MAIDKINQIFKIFYKNNPFPKTELLYSNEFTLLIAIILSARATDVSVNKATQELFKVATSPSDILKLGLNKVRSYIKTIGLYNSKAINLIKLSFQLLNLYNGKIPKNFEQLLKLPGVGRKTANVFLNNAYGMGTIGVDTHVFRVSKRLGIVKGNSLKAIEDELANIIPLQWKALAHNWLVLHGRYVCKARNPLCDICQLQNLCHYYLKNSKNL